MRISLIMAMALFPDAVDFQYVPGPQITIGYHDPKDFLEALRSRDRQRMADLSAVEKETITLEIITESPPWVMAGMSEKWHKVFIYEEEKDFREYE